MVKELIESIADKLRLAFPDCEIYTENMSPGLSEARFFIQCKRSQITPTLGIRYHQENLFCIQFFPEDELHGHTERFEVAETLTWILEYIDLIGDLVRGTNIKAETVDDVLNVFVNYDLFLYKDVEFDLMEEMEMSYKNE